MFMEKTDKPGRKKDDGGRRNGKVGEERTEVVAVITIKTGLFAKTSHCKTAER